MTFRTPIALLVLILPLLVPAGLAVKAMTDAASGRVWQVKVAGFDPVDPLRGHYLQFRYDWEDAAQGDPDLTSNPRAHLCLTAQPDSLLPVATPLPDCRQAQCDSCLSPLSAITGVQRYYIPESHAARLNTAILQNPDRFRVEITVPRSGGKPVIRGMLIDGKPLLDYIRQTDG